MNVPIFLNVYVSFIDASKFKVHCMKSDGQNRQ